MGRVYTVSFDQQTIAAASGDYDFFELDPATDKPIRVLGWHLDNKSEVGDAQEEMVAYAWVRGNTTSGNGTATTPRPIDSNDAAAGFAAETVSSTPASAGTAVNLDVGTFNIRTGGERWYPGTNVMPRTQGSDLLCLRLLTALADDATMSGTVWVEEL